MKTALALLLASSLAFADTVTVTTVPAAASVVVGSDAPVVQPMVPMTHDEAVAALTCVADLKDCQSTDRVAWKWVVIGTASGVIAGVLIGLGVTFAVKK